MKPATYWINTLELEKHPEGGWFKEIYRANDRVKVSSSGEKSAQYKNASTSIYYLLEKNEFSAFHRIKSDEIWHFHVGNSAIEIRWIEKGKLVVKLLGNRPEKNESLQIVVPKNCWFSACLSNKNGFALAGCTVAPGFDFTDFEMADYSLIHQFPELTDVLKPFIKK